MKRNTRVSTAVIRRLPRYYRQLSELQRKGVIRISSSALGKSMGLAAFDVQERTVGTQIAGVPVYHADTLEEFLQKNPVSVGLLTVPKSAAQVMGERLVAAGVHGIWNFTNCEIAFPGEDVVVESVHFSDSLLALSYMISQREDGQEQEDGKDET